MGIGNQLALQEEENGTSGWISSLSQEQAWIGFLVLFLDRTGPGLGRFCGFWERFKHCTRNNTHTRRVEESFVTCDSSALMKTLFYKIPSTICSPPSSSSSVHSSTPFADWYPHPASDCAPAYVTHRIERSPTELCFSYWCALSESEWVVRCENLINWVFYAVHTESFQWLFVHITMVQFHVRESFDARDFQTRSGTAVEQYKTITRW